MIYLLQKITIWIKKNINGGIPSEFNQEKSHKNKIKKKWKKTFIGRYYTFLEWLRPVNKIQFFKYFYIKYFKKKPFGEKYVTKCSYHCIILLPMVEAWSKYICHYHLFIDQFYIISKICFTHIAVTLLPNSI